MKAIEQSETEQARDVLITQLSELTLPLMWSLRQDAMRTFEPLGVRPIQALLFELIAHGIQQPKMLSDMLDILPPTISSMLADLENRGLIARSIDPQDKRRVQLELTEAGYELRHLMQEGWHKTGRERLGQLSVEELESLLAIYQKLLESK